MPADTADATRTALLNLMRAHRASRRDVAQACGCSPQLVSRWIQGTRGIQARWLPALAEYFGCSEQFIRYGRATDTDALAAIAAGIIAALEDHGVVSSSLAADQVGQLVAWGYEHYADHAAPPNAEAFARMIKLLDAGGVPAELAPRKAG